MGASSERERRFEGGEALRSAAEQESRRKLTREEWDQVDPTGWSGHPYSVYSETDLNDLVSSISQLPPPRKPSVTKRQRSQALAHRQRTASEARAFVEEQRVFLFGSGNAPFEKDVKGAAEWIESQAENRGAFLFSLEVAIPVEHGEGLAPLFRVRDWLIEALDGLDPTDSSFEAIRGFKTAEDSPLRQINSQRPLLAYLAPVDGDWGIKHVCADDGTSLGNLREACQKLSRATGWIELDSCHHLMTGGVMSSPVRAVAHNRMGRESFGGPSITIEVPNPDGVRVDEVAKAYQSARDQIIRPPTSRSGRRRSTLSPRLEKLASFVSDTPEMPWTNRLSRWNSQYPEFAFPTHDAMRQAFRRLT